MPYLPEQEARRKQLEHDLFQANIEKSAIVSAERKEQLAAERAIVEKQVLSEMALIDKPSDNPSVMLGLLERLSDCRNLTAREEHCRRMCHWLMVWRENMPLFSKV